MAHCPVRSVAIISSLAFSLSNFRGPLIQRLIRQGLRVYALAPDYDATSRAAVRALGAEPVDISLDRTGLKPVRDLADMLRLVIVLRMLKPDLVFGYFIKPVIYGTIAAWLAGVSHRYALIAGLGYVFTPDGSRETVKRRVLRTTASMLYAVAFRLCRRVFLQNPDDRQVLSDLGALPPSKSVLVSGSGVDLGAFAAVAPMASPLQFVLVARLLREKGIVEYVEAARRIRADHPDVIFTLVGDVDTNPGGLPKGVVQGWVAEGVIEWPGRVHDVRPWLARASVFVLPSYREGKPRSTQEAMAIGRAVVTTDAPGCRDTVDEGVNGFKVPVRDVDALEAALRRFVADPALVAAMGAQSRRLAEERFDVHRINAQMLSAMELGGDHAAAA